MGRLFYILLALSFITYSCNNNKAKNKEDNNISSSDSAQVGTPDAENGFEFRTTGNTVGLVSMIVSDSVGLPECVTLFNKDGSIWMTFDYDYGQKLNKSSYTMDDIKALFPTWKEEFHPWAFKIDYLYLVFRCVSQDESSYSVIVDENTGLEKILRKSKNFEFQTWEQHLFQCIIGLYSVNNILRELPDENSSIIFEDTEGYSFEAMEIKGDWVKLKNIENQEIEGWIRWLDGDKLLVEFYYSL